MAKRRNQNRTRYNRKALGVKIDAMPMTIPGPVISGNTSTGAAITVGHISNILPD